MDIRKIKKLIELVEESGISELEISEGEESVRISRAAPAASFPVMQQAYAAPMMQQPAQSNAAAPATVPSMEAPAAAEISGHIVRSRTQERSSKWVRKSTWAIPCASSKP